MANVQLELELGGNGAPRPDLRRDRTPLGSLNPGLLYAPNRLISRRARAARIPLPCPSAGRGLSLLLSLCTAASVSELLISGGDSVSIPCGSCLGTKYWARFPPAPLWLDDEDVGGGGCGGCGSSSSSASVALRAARLARGC